MTIDEGRTFLGVKRSLGNRRWVDRLSPQQANIALAIAQKNDISDLVSRILAGRGIDIEGSKDFLNPTLKQLMPDPYCLQDMEKAVERLFLAIKNQESVAIFGDYDVDGATSSAILCRFLNHFGVKTRIYIPDRILEGYGPNPLAINQLIEDGAGLIVTVDCGVTSFEALEEAAKKDIDVLVLDHHQVGVDLPKAHAIVNPNRQDDVSNLGHLAAVGVVFMTLVAVQRLMRERAPEFASSNSFNLMNLLDIVALGTVCDVVPLRTLNRAFVMRGIEKMRAMNNEGLKALSRVARVDGPILPYHLGFLLGPRINAGGRIGDAALGARLLTLDDGFRAEEIALKLDALNAERQALEKIMLEEADAQAFRETGGEEEGGPAVLITSSEEWHPGVLGIVASRLKERYRRPVFAIGFDKSGKGTGSGRSITGVDLGKVVREAVEEGLLLKGGGHAMAAGLTISSSQLDDLKAFMEERLSMSIQKARADNALSIDGALSARGATLDLLDEIEKAGPYGAGHPSPVFAFPSHKITYVDRVGNGHVKLSIKSSDGVSLSAIAFRAAEEPLGKALLEGRQQVFHFAGQLSKNTWQGRVSVQCRIMDAAPPETF